MASPKKKNTEAKGNKGTAGGGGTGRFCKRVSAKRPVRRRVFFADCRTVQLLQRAPISAKPTCIYYGRTSHSHRVISGHLNVM